MFPYTSLLTWTAAKARP